MYGGKVKAFYYMVGMTISNAVVSVLEHRLTFDEEQRRRVFARPLVAGSPHLHFPAMAQFVK